MGSRVPEFWITADQMREEGLPGTLDYFRFQKGADKFPFICVHTDDSFLKMISLDEMEWPDNIEFASTRTELTNPMPGIYKMAANETPPEILLDTNEKQMNPLSEKEEFLKHLGKMKNQPLDMDMDETLFRSLLLRKHLKQQQFFTYKENLDFSLLNVAASSNPDYPQKWNYNNIPGPLKSLCSGNGGLNNILGVSTAMMYAGKEGTYSSWHVEDADCPSCNLLLPYSAGKAWIGINPDDQLILDEHIISKLPESCCSPTLHKNLMVDLDLLDELNIRWYYFIQRPGDIIITNPLAPHQVVNLGFNLAEATNFYVSRLFVTARRRVACKCSERLQRYDHEAWKRIATFIYSGEFRFLCQTNGIPIPSPEEVLSQLLDECSQMDDSLNSDSTDIQPESIVEVLKRWSQENLHESPPVAEGTVVTCQILVTQPLDISNIFVDSAEDQGNPLSQPQDTLLASPQDTPLFPPQDNSLTLPQDTPLSQPQDTILASSQDTPLSLPQDVPSKHFSSAENIPDSRSDSKSPAPRSNTLETPVNNPPPSQTSPPRGRKRKNATLGEDPDSKQKRKDALADYWSQRAWERGNFDPNLQPESREDSQPPSISDPRIEAANRIEKNTETYEAYKESRKAARANHSAKNGKGLRPNKAASSWFKDYLQRATRKIGNSEKKIAEYAARGTKPLQCSWEAKLASATSIKKNLEHRRLLHNALQKMYKYCQDDLKQRLDEGYLEREIFRDFVLFHSKENKKLLRAALKAHHADFSYWNKVLNNEEAWNAEFGVDEHYRIPCVEFSKLRFNVLDFL